jgi:hypothetical protein
MRKSLQNFFVRLGSVTSVKICEPREMMVRVSITPSPGRGGVMGRRPGVESTKRGDVVPNPPAIAGTLAIHGGEEIRVPRAQSIYTLPQNYLLVFQYCGGGTRNALGG